MYGTRVTAARVKYLLNTDILSPDQIFTESTLHHMISDVDRGLPVAIRRLYFSDSLIQLSQRHSEIPEEEIRKLIEQTQENLLEIEHENVAEVMVRLGNGDRLDSIPNEYYDLLFCPPSLDKNEELIKAKTWAVEQYPK